MSHKVGKMLATYVLGQLTTNFPLANILAIHIQYFIVLANYKLCNILSKNDEHLKEIRSSQSRLVET